MYIYVSLEIEDLAIISCQNIMEVVDAVYGHLRSFNTLKNKTIGKLVRDYLRFVLL